MIEDAVAARDGDRLGALVSRYSNPIKGILVFLVVLDHNDWFRLLAPELFKPLTFHVLGFFFLAFTFGAHRLNAGFVLDRVGRYLVPFWFFLTLASLGFALVTPQAAPQPRLVAWLLAVAIGNAPFVKASAGLLMLWFLPCLFGLACLVAAFDTLTSTSARRLAWVSALVLHLVIPLFAREDAMWLPFGLAVAADIFVLGLLWRSVSHKRLPSAWGLVAALAMLASYGTLVRLSINVEIATLDVYGVNRPGLMLLQDVAGFSGVVVVVCLARMVAPIRWIDAVGRQSMLVYLIHPLVYQVCAIAARRFGLTNHEPLTLLFQGSVATLVALGSAYAAAVGISRSPSLSAWITPRTLSAWPPARLWARA